MSYSLFHFLQRHVFLQVVAFQGGSSSHIFISTGKFLHVVMNTSKTYKAAPYTHGSNSLTSHCSSAWHQPLHWQLFSMWLSWQSSPMETFWYCSNEPSWSSLRPSILLSGFSKEFYGHAVDTPPFAALVQKPNQELNWSNSLLSSHTPHGCLIFLFLLRSDELFYIVFKLRPDSALDLKPGIMTKALTLWAAYTFSNICSQRGQHWGGQKCTQVLPTKEWSALWTVKGNPW